LALGLPEPVVEQYLGSGQQQTVAEVLETAAVPEIVAMAELATA